ncbi:transketolase [Ceraceosorus guamensis]|uniref:transketolase n=1 Tax=Ceraceosorus guamensis TaxID=1522189 RepID=A0A316VXE5_9BASI|nr:transketolase [Ceraceosorus guamensis]PWN40961.1 transketolase [Ceraceosorus guamensis]
MAPAPIIEQSHDAIRADRPVQTKPKASILSPDFSALTLSNVRCLVADLVQQFNGGHPGTAMGAAAIGLVLWRDVMRFNPADAKWLGRDRFVLSAGHACLLQYVYLHLCGYKSWTMDMLKRYHSPDFRHSQSAGHPEIEYEGIEVTTGPLGQGISNAVGLAMAAKHLQATYDRNSSSDEALFDQKVYCFSGDGCIQEGVGVEAASLAGHLRLDNLILIYDCNAITVDGNIDLCFTEDTAAKFQAMNWHVIDVGPDATNDVDAITKALRAARDNNTGKPVLVKVVTTIGFGSANQGLAPTHGAALGAADVVGVKKLNGRDEELSFHVDQQVYDGFAAVQNRGAEWQQEWQEKLHSQLRAQLSGELTSPSTEDIASLLPSKERLPTSAVPTRKSSGIAVEAIAPALPNLVTGSADLAASTFVSWPDMEDFQAPQTGYGSYAGRHIHYGIREHAMAGVANGLAAYHPNALVPVISTFFMFFLYAAPAIRMAALQRLRLIGIATHDSIGIGEDGPTHQPIGLASLFRAMPNLSLFRPADAEEVMGCWSIALSKENEGVPSILTLSRQGVPLLAGSSRHGVQKGAYIVWQSTDSEVPQVVLVATGSEVAIAVAAAEKLAKAGISARVVSMPCQNIFDKQPGSYKSTILPLSGSLIVAVEVWSSYGWARYAHASLSMHTFGLSGPQAQLYEHFGFSPSNVAAKVQEFLQRHRAPDGRIKTPPVGAFEELLLPS